MKRCRLWMLGAGADRQSPAGAAIVLRIDVPFYHARSGDGRHLGDEIAVMDRGRVVEQGVPEKSSIRPNKKRHAG